VGKISALNEVDTVYPLRPSLHHFGGCHLAAGTKDGTKLGFGMDWDKTGQIMLRRDLDVNTTTTLTIPLRFTSTLLSTALGGTGGIPPGVFGVQGYITLSLSLLSRTGQED
jgi:hypothetical protein